MKFPYSAFLTIKKTLCEVLFWFNPQKSLVYLSITRYFFRFFQILTKIFNFSVVFHLFYFAFSNGIIYVVCYFFLFKLWHPIWTERIWVSSRIFEKILKILANDSITRTLFSFGVDHSRSENTWLRNFNQVRVIMTSLWGHLRSKCQL